MTLYLRFKVKAAKKEMIIKINKVKKLSFKLDISAKNPSRTGPTKKPKNPTPEINDILTGASKFGVFPPNRNNSGIITESPKPTKPNPIITINGVTNKIRPNPKIANISPNKSNILDPKDLLIASPKNRPTAIVAENTVYPKPSQDSLANETFFK